MIKGKTLTPVLLAGVFFLMLGLSFAAVPLYDMFCRITGFGGTTQVSKEAPKVVLDKVVSVRFDTNVNNLTWDFKAKSNVMDVKVGQVNRIEFEVENYGDETTYGASLDTCVVPPNPVIRQNIS
jgi:cytochrome c oxidase assembly protein subunit 11